MKVVGIYGSPRKGGNSDSLLDILLKGVTDSSVSNIMSIYCREFMINGCLNCGSCNKTGKCIIKDDMQSIYPFLERADAIILAIPVFFYAAPSQAKALIDRCQANWSNKRLIKDRGQGKNFNNGKGYLLCVGATKGKNLFQGIELMAKYFYDALGMYYAGGLLLRGLDGKGAVKKHPEILKQAYTLGKHIVSSSNSSS